MLIIHHNDEDGRCSAAIVFNALRDLYTIEFHSADYGQDPPWEEMGRHGKVWIIDFSYPPEVMAQIYEEYKGNAIWIDHHVTAIQSICLPFPGGRATYGSACLLTWNYAHPSSATPGTVFLISQYDTGNFTPECKQFVKGLEMLDQSPTGELWRDLLFSETREQRVKELISAGELLVRYQLRQNRNTLEKYGHVVELSGHQAMKVNAPMRADGFEALKEYAPEIPILWIWTEYQADGKTLRRNILYSDSVDVGDIAKSLGGGGHKGAAGFVEILTNER